MAGNSLQQLVKTLKDKGFTQQKLSSLTGLSQTTISFWSRGKRTNYAERILKLIDLGGHPAPKAAEPVADKP